MRPPNIENKSSQNRNNSIPESASKRRLETFRIKNHAPKKIIAIHNIRALSFSRESKWSSPEKRVAKRPIKKIASTGKMRNKSAPSKSNDAVKKSQYNSSKMDKAKNEDFTLTLTKKTNSLKIKKEKKGRTFLHVHSAHALHSGWHAAHSFGL